ncbi:hypothetical protein EJV46_07925 [Roseococcus sp. SYP-B2431]|uniref:hypothetical protein n=1 Tax=Roseococcus sp. SYP-B2431 TaxID=2496640 RepID=UPI00103DCE73|nr:hypothetical protein [Roseococcus sp. SYP-B2431]TCH99203.1 hypothetical protein EJV46_07925 [Roseococcus sp. SYP-B2431]
MMDKSPVPDPDDIRRSFAAERSHNDAVAVNEHARAAVNLMVVINGGAATALLAFANRPEAGPNVVLLFGIASFAIGVVVGALNIRVLTRTTFSYMEAWHSQAHGDQSGADFKFAEAKRGQRHGDAMFLAALISFSVGILLSGTSILLL